MFCSNRISTDNRVVRSLCHSRASCKFLGPSLGLAEARTVKFSTQGDYNKSWQTMINHPQVMHGWADVTHLYMCNYELSEIKNAVNSRSLCLHL